jgi:hypothetical protein
MALDTKFQSKNDVNVYIGTEITMGTATLGAGTWNKAPVVDYSIQAKQAPLGVAPQRSNTFGQPESGLAHDRTQQLFEISLTMHATASVINRICGALYEDSDGTNALLGNSPATVSFKDGSSNTVPVTLLFENGGSNDNDLKYTSCLCTSMELAYAIGTDGGAMTCTATFVTGYEPTEESLTPSSSTDMAGTIMNIFDVTTQQLGGQDLLLHNFNLNISRAVNRVSWSSASNYKPLGYSIGMYEVTGVFGCKRDANSIQVPTNTSAGIALSVQSTSPVLQIDAPDVVVESVSTDLADEGWKEEFSFRAFFDDSSQSNPIVTIATS